MRWLTPIRQRAATWKTILGGRVFVGVTAAWTAFSNFTTVRDSVLPAGKIRDALQNLDFVPVLSPWAWAFGVLAILFVTAMEGAYREISARDAVIDQGKPKPPVFDQLVQLNATDQHHDVNLTLVNTAETDWFIVSVLQVRPRLATEGPNPPWEVKWADTDEIRRHVPKNSTAHLRLCRIESQQDDRALRAIRARFFTPTNELEITLSLAEAWNAQNIFIGFHLVIPEFVIRVSAEGANKATDRRVSITLNDQLVPHVYKTEVVLRQTKARMG